MTTEYNIRTIRKDELRDLLELYKHLHPIDAPLPPQSILEKKWRKIWEDSHFQYFVAEINGRFVSTCTISIIPNFTRGARPYGVIENVVTHPEFRRKGLAKAVLNYALQYAWNSNCYKVMLLSAVQRDAAHCLYSNVGFSKEAKVGYVAKPSGMNIKRNVD